MGSSHHGQSMAAHGRFNQTPSSVGEFVYIVHVGAVPQRLLTFWVLCAGPVLAKVQANDGDGLLVDYQADPP